MNIYRPAWANKPKDSPTIDLSKNVHYDKIINDVAKIKLAEIDDFNNYPVEYNLYEAISDYYEIPIPNLAIGHGSTDILDRIIRTMNYDTLYIVDPAFQMVEIYCRLYEKNHVKISYEDACDMKSITRSAIYIASPNGNNGKAYDVTPLINRFDLCIIDEVYGDFYDSNSLLHNTPSNVIILKSLSKSLGLAGLRVGFSKASDDITMTIQQHRMNYVSNSLAEYLVPKLLVYTSEVISRMNRTKAYLESNHICSESKANYVLFREPNRYTDKFGYKLVNGYYRMALTDMETLNG